uniref:Uncharacterized protein n=1 Tax=Picea glauca TaxID=3330 RepID=A0A117NGM7_PICGL|nr:hypothetical protein ABT39_MTgene6032 [Picea glauca]
MKVVRSFNLLITSQGVCEALIYMQLRSRLELSSFFLSLAETTTVDGSHKQLSHSLIYPTHNPTIHWSRTNNSYCYYLLVEDTSTPICCDQLLDPPIHYYSRPILKQVQLNYGDLKHIHIKELHLL